MPYAPKIVLCVPLKDRSALPQFVEDCLRDKVVLIAVVGDGCDQVEDLIDEMIVGDGSDQERFIMTSSHPNESIEDAMHFATFWVCDDGRDGTQKITF